MVMPKLKVRGTIPVFQVSHFTKRLEACLMREQKNAIRAWARAVISNIPTYTGTALGTFAPLNRTIKKLGITSPSGIKAAARAKIRRGAKIQGVSYSLGFQAGKRYSSHDVSHTVTRTVQEYHFSFDEDLPYVMWNEIQPAPSWITLPSNPPWHAFAAGQIAFEYYVKTEIPRAIGRDVPTVKLIRIG